MSEMKENIRNEVLRESTLVGEAIDLAIDKTAKAIFADLEGEYGLHGVWELVDESKAIDDYEYEKIKKKWFGDDGK